MHYGLKQDNDWLPSVTCRQSTCLASLFNWDSRFVKCWLSVNQVWICLVTTMWARVTRAARKKLGTWVDRLTWGLINSQSKLALLHFTEPAQRFMTSRRHEVKSHPGRWPSAEGWHILGGHHSTIVHLLHRFHTTGNVTDASGHGSPQATKGCPAAPQQDPECAKHFLAGCLGCSHHLHAQTYPETQSEPRVKTPILW